MESDIDIKAFGERLGTTALIIKKEIEGLLHASSDFQAALFRENIKTGLRRLSDSAFYIHKYLVKTENKKDNDDALQ